MVSDVYSFEEEEAVLDPHISEHLSHFGIDMLQMQKRVSCLDCIIHSYIYFRTICQTKTENREISVYSSLHSKVFTPSSPLCDIRQRTGTTQTITPGRGSVNGR